MIALVRDLILKDFWLKLFSLALGILTWFTIAFALDQQGSPVNTLGLKFKERSFYHLPVTILSSAADVRDFKVSPATVKVTVQGESRVLDRLESAEIRALVDLSGIESARALRKRIEVSTPAGVSPMKVEPSEVEVIFPPKAPDAGK